MAVQSAKELMVYKKAYALAMQVFEVSKRFPVEERFALTGQIRRSSRSVCNNLREAWAKRRYEAHFVSKLTDCDGENSETSQCPRVDETNHVILRLCSGANRAWFEQHRWSLVRASFV